MRLATLFVVALLIMLLSAGTALASWPGGAQGDQYESVNAAMVSAVAGVGISPDTFISIYDTAAANGDLSGFSDSQLAAACEVLTSLASYESVLVDYDTVYNSLGCGTALESSGPTRSSLPSTGFAVALLAGAGIAGMGAAAQILRKNR